MHHPFIGKIVLKLAVEEEILKIILKPKARIQSHDGRSNKLSHD